MEKVMPVEKNPNEIQRTLRSIENRVDKYFERGVSLQKNTKTLDNGTIIERNSVLDKKVIIQRTYTLKREDVKSGRHVEIKISEDYQNKQRIPIASEINYNERTGVSIDWLEEGELENMLQFLGVKI